MSLVTVEDLCLAFGSRTLFAGVGFALAAGDRVGLIGRNGMGKTSLFRALVGELQPDGGVIRVARGVRLGYLPQDVAAPSQGLLLQSVLDAVPGRSQLEAELAQVEAELEAAAGDEAQADLAWRLGELQLLREHHQTRFARHEAERILCGLGFSPTEFERPLAELSGGWRMRAALAALLFQQPEVLLLDEPTNHLDLPSVQWFDAFLRRYQGAFLLVSHDRELINRQVARLLSLEFEGLRAYSGNYEKYLALRAEEDQLLQNRAKNLERERRQIERFVERFKAKASKARAASSKAKVLRKMEQVQTLDLPKEMRFHFPEAPPSGRQVLRVEGLRKAFGARQLYQDLDLTVFRGERVALVGANGTGKTTLLRILAGELPPDAGGVSFGHQVEFGYYAQHCADALHPSLNVLQTVWEDVPDRSQTAVRGVLGTFLFSGDDALKPVGVLSGGERARVALARLVVRPSNLMIMDEPTNHLDLNASEALAEALAGYGGTLLFVSHNLSLLRRVATKVWELRDGQVREHLGGFDSYAAALEGAPPAEAGEADGATAAAPTATRTRRGEKERRRIEAQRRQELSRKLGELPRQIAELEAQIAELETQQQQLQLLLAQPDVYQDKARFPELLRQHEQVNHRLERALQRWEALEERRGRIAAEVAPDADEP